MDTAGNLQQTQSQLKIHVTSGNRIKCLMAAAENQTVNETCKRKVMKCNHLNLLSHKIRD
jgi:hypothetical protein